MSRRRSGPRAPALPALLVLPILALTAGRATESRAERAPIVGDSRDAWTLLPQHLVNRQLFEQLAEPGSDLPCPEATRLGFGHRVDWLAVAADLSVRTVQPPDNEIVRFHGMFLADLYLALRLVDGLDANLDVTAFNPSASDPYRSSSQILPGVALHAHGRVLELFGDPLRLDLVATDLGWVTAGAGLLLEQTPLEGILAQASWREHVLRWLFGGRALWPDDDFVSTSLALFGGLVEVQVVEWRFQYNLTPEALAAEQAAQARPDFGGQVELPAGYPAWYSTLTLRLPITDELHLAAEYGARLDRGPKSGLLARLDYLRRARDPVAFHAGYQFRWYQRGFGPRGQLVEPTLPFNVPRREDTYVTNSFEILGLSPAFDQWSHTVMLEARTRPDPHVELFLEGEAWLRFAKGTSGLVVVAPDGFRAPGAELDLYYRGGVSVLPWPELPAALRAFATNKQVESEDSSSTPVDRRFIGRSFRFALEVEVKL